MDPVTLFFAGVAAFVIFRLISVMGARTGHEQSPENNGLARAAADKARDNASVDDDDRADAPVKPKPVSTHGRVLREADPAFDEIEFLTGARGAYEMIVEAFASGDLKSIRPYLSESVYDAFRGAVVAREGAGHHADLKFVGIERAALVDSSADRDAMTAVVEFASNQVRVTRDKDGEVVDGDPNRVDLVKDRWTFTKKRASRDPNWTLVATGGGA
ncbi:MAG: Tim44/TimA family putative adaptor protein [Parvularculaceae bacterium]